MTDHDNLRDRIEEVIWKRTTLTTDITMHVAQAIIDELGLTTETHAATHAKRNMTRIISAWEWEN